MRDSKMRGNIKEKKMGPLRHRWGSKATRDAAAEGGQPGLQGPQSPFRGQGSVDTDMETRDILACLAPNENFNGRVKDFLCVFPF